MKKTIALALAAILATSAAPAALATEYSTGTVMKLDAKAKKVTVDHGELKNLEMPAMTMVFRAANDEILGRLSEGQEIEFVAERVDGKLTITEVK